MLADHCQLLPEAHPRFRHNGPGDSIALRLGQESQRIELLSNTLVDVAVRAGETVAGKAAQLRSTGL